MATQIPVSQLRVGMTVMKTGPSGKLIPDVTLLKYFPTSSRFPSLSFEVGGGKIVVWRNVGYVWVKL